MKKLLSRLAALLIRLVAATLRVTTDDGAGVLFQTDHPPFILAFWHNRMLLMAPFFRKYCPGRISYTFISRSRDGEFITDVAACFGVKALRGSTSRHGRTAALAALRQAEDTRADICITPDGPRGPLYEVQPGVLRLAQASGRSIVAVTTHCAWKIELRSWDRFQIPLPFSRCHLVLAPPIHIPAGADDDRLNAYARQLREALED